MFTAPGDEASALAENIRKVIEFRNSNSARSKQKAIGVSEVGDPCPRKLAYKILDWEQVNKSTDSWMAIQGTAVHDWLAKAFEKFNQGDKPRFLIEYRVQITNDLAGTFDLYDIADGIIIDHKCVGSTSLKSRKAGGATPQQIIQVNLYGLGLEQEGYTINKVALAYYPLGGRLDGMHLDLMDYNRQIALDAIKRFEGIKQLVWELDPEKNPERWQLFPAVTGSHCVYCPFYLPKSEDLSIGCPGEVNAS